MQNAAGRARHFGGRHGGGGGGRGNWGRGGGRRGRGGGGRWHGGGRGGGRGGHHNKYNNNNNNNNRQSSSVKPLIDRDTTVIEQITANATTNDSGEQQHSIRIAIEGCCHGELEAIYARLQRHEREEESKTSSTLDNDNNHKKIDLLLCCGDFESLRNLADLHTLAVPQKYQKMGSFYKYYSGELAAPYLTIFVGGNHEASQSLAELHYGGWVAPNIYYLGAAGVVALGMNRRDENDNKNTPPPLLRIGGASGIYKPHDFDKGRHERPPYNRGTMRSAYHVRNVDMYRLSCLQGQQQQQEMPQSPQSAPASSTSNDNNILDVMLTHDWPQGIEQHGDTATLIRRKPHFEREIQQNCLGSPPTWQLLQRLKPRWWFAAHLHVKFRATVVHDQGGGGGGGGGGSGGDDKKNEESDIETKNNNNSSSNGNGQVTDLVPTSAIRTGSSQTRKRKATETETASEGHQDETNREVSKPGEQGAQNETTTEESKASQIQQTNNDNKNSPATTTTTNFVAPSQTNQSCSGLPDLTDLMTQFLSLDKCLPRRHFLTLVDVPVANRPLEGKLQLEYDAEWLAILRKTHHLSSTSPHAVQVPDAPSFVNPDEMAWVRQRLQERNNKNSDNAMAIPLNFCPTVPAIPHGSEMEPLPRSLPPPMGQMGNPQTDELLQLLELEHIVTVPYAEGTDSQQREQCNFERPHTAMEDDNEIDLEGQEENDGEVQPMLDADVDDNEIDLEEEED